ncbi:tRNA uridine-5-carboxymethylaminomethyl(34) synthesis enzyme MnmG [Buchnera aphidicola]|uniref:tRNA uridine-5-carboxymethylaminomethyl(34) synthesis enzyme MnmG n=1 Tax=Buchnera aphidicola TaxID=9 RepID=UPI0031B8109B
MFNKKIDVIVIGGGHAGTEASIASSKMGCSTLLITNNINNIGSLSCNPSIGGIGKSHLVKEIDALGGVMARAIDYSGIHFKILNFSKGIAVRSLRAQADRFTYHKAIMFFLKKQKNLNILQSEVIKLIIKNKKIIGVKLNNKKKIYSKITILTTGTFLSGKIYIGKNIFSGGRINDFSSIKLSKQLKKFSFNINKLKTGTPPRILINTINFKKLNYQKSDIPIPKFSFLKNNIKHLKQIKCFLTYTNENTHKIIKNNIYKSPMYNGTIKSIGPRYCPSIEDKIMKFKHHNSHQIFLEPEGLFNNEIYPNGISTSLPFSIQKKIINSIYGLEKAVISKPGYAVEYNYLDPRDLYFNLESKIIKNLFLAGQINGTTGYEEAASQGLLAGINAGLKILKKPLWYPKRHEAYLGVLINDLCLKGTKEPYRMFTSRAEYRLLLREDNADLRLTKLAKELNLINNLRWKFYLLKKKNIKYVLNKFNNINILSNSKENKKINKILKKKIKKKINIKNLLKYPEINFKYLTKFDFFKKIKNIDFSIIEQVETNIKYKGYIKRQKKEIKIQKLYQKKNNYFKKKFDYSKIKGLSNEVIYKLNLYQPSNLNKALLISGITPAAISIILNYFKKNKN